jgi:hypothetical protein
MVGGCGRRRVNRHTGKAGGEILHNRGESQERFSKPVLRIRDVYPGSKNSNKREGLKKLLSYLFL